MHTMTPDQIATIRQYAALQFTPAEIEAMMELSAGSIADSEPATKAMVAGNLLAQALVRRTLFDAAKEGDRAAASAFMRLAERNGMELVGE